VNLLTDGVPLPIASHPPVRSRRLGPLRGGPGVLGNFRGVLAIGAAERSPNPAVALDLSYLVSSFLGSTVPREGGERGVRETTVVTERERLRWPGVQTGAGSSAHEDGDRVQRLTPRGAERVRSRTGQTRSSLTLVRHISGRGAERGGRSQPGPDRVSGDAVRPPQTRTPRTVFLRPTSPLTSDEPLGREFEEPETRDAGSATERTRTASVSAPTGPASSVALSTPESDGRLRARDGRSSLLARGLVGRPAGGHTVSFAVERQFPPGNARPVADAVPKGLAPRFAPLVERTTPLVGSAPNGEPAGGVESNRRVLAVRRRLPGRLDGDSSSARDVPSAAARWSHPLALRWRRRASGGTGTSEKIVTTTAGSLVAPALAPKRSGGERPFGGERGTRNGLSVRSETRAGPSRWGGDGRRPLGVDVGSADGSKARETLQRGPRNDPGLDSFERLTSPAPSVGRPSERTFGRANGPLAVLRPARHRLATPAGSQGQFGRVGDGPSDGNRLVPDGVRTVPRVAPPARYRLAATPAAPLSVRSAASERSSLSPVRDGESAAVATGRASRAGTGRGFDAATTPEGFVAPPVDRATRLTYRTGGEPRRPSDGRPRRTASGAADSGLSAFETAGLQSTPGGPVGSAGGGVETTTASATAAAESTPNAPTAPSFQSMSRHEMDRLVDRLYGQLERKLRVERERRGL
jgi:hypothetical protein